MKSVNWRNHDRPTLEMPKQTERTRPLFPAPRDRIAWDDDLTRLLADANARIAGGSVTPTLDMADFRTSLAGFDFNEPHPLGELLSWTVAQLEQGLVHINHPQYFGLFNPAPSFPAQCADRIVASFNPQLATLTTSPVAVEIEAHVIRAVAHRAGFPPGSSGHFTTGGAESNFTAMICALTRASEQFSTRGARAFDRPPTFYISKESHLAWIKIAHQAGIGRSAVRLVATDGSGRMDAQALADTIRDDVLQGYVPIMVVATAGTTGAGMIDPLAACAAIARQHDMWYHVDAAWGGALIASDRLCHLLMGIEQSDSITIDAHKWFATTMGCGMFIIRDASVLSSVFHVSTDYMPSNLAHLDPYVTSVQWSRRFLGLRLFLSLAAVGWNGYAAHVERSVELADRLGQRLRDRGWSIMNDARLAVLCLVPPAGSDDVRCIVARVLASGRAWISTAKFEDHDIIRACITHGESTENNVAELVDAMVAACHGTGAGS